jgi:molybdenum cofactor cytidylyltransferase
MTFAVVPAAGRSRRMGRPKLSLPLGGRTVLDHVLTALRRGGVVRVLVVVGPHVPELVPIAKAAGAEVCQSPDDSPNGMRASVQEGLRWLEERYRPHPDDPWLLAPGDHPALDPAVVRTLLEAWADRPRESILIPTYQGRRGHPALFAWRHVGGIRAHPPGLGLNTFLRCRLAETREVPVDCPGVLTDIDTPEDYERFRRAATPGCPTL